MRNPREGTSVVLRDTIKCTVYLLCDLSSPREVCTVKGGIGSAETLCHDIYPALPIYNHCFSGD